MQILAVRESAWRTSMITSLGSGKDRRSFLGGSDARIIMGDDEAGLVRL
jgi:hypothetical protein